jgi:hypothetical protein
MKDIHIKAQEVQLGDNVWEHNIVTSMKYDRETNTITFNDNWTAKPNDMVMVTNRPENKETTITSNISISHSEAGIVLTALRELISACDYPVTDSQEFSDLLKKVYEFAKVDGNPY